MVRRHQFVSRLEEVPKSPLVTPEHRLLQLESRDVGAQSLL